MKLGLVGLPGSGKSTVGRQLARRLAVPFFDSDQVIEQRLGCSIRLFFEREGEAAFRDHETAVIDELCALDRCVLATGGGSVLREENRKRLRSLDRVFYLQAAPEQLFSRVRRDRGRPLLQVADPLERLRQLCEERDPLYRETAHTVVEAGGLSARLVVARIVESLQQAGLPGSRQQPHL